MSLRGLILFVVFSSCFALSQNTSVTGQVTDSSGQAWVNGTFTFTFVGPQNVQWTGGVFPNNPITGSLTPSGAVPNTNVPDNNQINPPNTQWNVQVCSATLPQVCFSQILTVTGSSQTISPAPRSITIRVPTVPSAILPVSAYADAEILGGWTGFSYYNLVSAGIRVCTSVSSGTCATWSNVSGSPSGIFNVKSYGAVGDGVTNDLSALQASVNAADAAGGGTVVLGPGNFNISTGTWKIGNANSQHHINIAGVNLNSTTIKCDSSGGNAAIYLNQNKYITLSDFSVINQGTKAGYGIQFGGDGGTGTQTNGDIVRQMYFQGFTYGTYMSGGIGTSSEIKFDHDVWSNNTYGFYAANFNALNFLFELPEIYNNTTAGFFIANGNMTVLGGASNGNGVDFIIQGGNDGQAKIVGFRAELPVGDWLQINANNYLSIEDCIVHPTSTGVEVINATGELHIKNSTLNGYITWNGSTQSAITLDHVSVNTPGTDWSLTNQLSVSVNPYGPGFRMTSNTGFQAGTRVYITDVFEGSNSSMYPDIQGVLIARPSDNKRSIVALDKGQGATLTISANTISPYAYLHHVNDNGLIKSINPVAGFGDWAVREVLIPDLAFTTDTTGNIGKASTAVVGQPMIFTKDLSNGKWYPSY